MPNKFSSATRPREKLYTLLNSTPVSFPSARTMLANKWGRWTEIIYANEKIKTNKIESARTPHRKLWVVLGLMESEPKRVFSGLFSCSSTSIYCMYSHTHTNIRIIDEYNGGLIDPPISGRNLPLLAANFMRRICLPWCKSHLVDIARQRRFQ